MSREPSVTCNESFTPCGTGGIESFAPGELSPKKFNRWILNGKNSAAERASDADENSDVAKRMRTSIEMPRTIRETTRVRTMEIRPANIDVMVGITTGIEKTVGCLWTSIQRERVTIHAVCYRSGSNGPLTVLHYLVGHC